MTHGFLEQDGAGQHGAPLLDTAATSGEGPRTWHPADGLPEPRSRPDWTPVRANPPVDRSAVAAGRGSWEGVLGW